jgi:ATP-dependent Clp protease ATP-binding subunit ClpC
MISEFARWHYDRGLKKLLEIWGNFVEFVWIYFSVATFFRTLFSPWRRDVSQVGLRGIHPIIFLKTLTENIFTRIIGAMLKAFLIVTAIIIEGMVSGIGIFVLLIWFTAPLAFLISLGEIVFSLTQGAVLLLTFWVIVFGTSLVIVVLSLRAFRFGEKDYYSMDLTRLSREKWFDRVWRRIGINGGEINLQLLSDPEGLKNYLNNLDLTSEEFLKIVDWEARNQTKIENDRKFWRRENLLGGLPLGKNWSFAYTVHLDKYVADLSEADYSEYRDAALIGKEKELEELELIMTRPSQNSVILIGEAGVGRDTIIHTLARKIRKNQAPSALINERLLEINLKEILSDVSSGDSSAVLQSLFSEAAYAGNVILVIRDIHEFLGSASNKSGYDISSILGDFLNYPNFQIIGTTTPGEFHASVEKKDRVIKYCDRIMIEEMSKDNTIDVLLYKLKSIEKDNIILTYQAIKEIVNLSDRYITSSPFPEKALDLMEETILFWSNNPHSSLIDKAVVDSAISSKIKVPLGEVTKDESAKLLDLETLLHQRVVGQDMAVNQIAETVRRARISMTQKDKPLGSFLFMGPTGVGKTESAKALAESYFGDENRMIRLDMSEYQSADSIPRIIGAPDGREGYLVSKVKENPYALLLLDEIEKAHPDLLNLFLQVLDEGHLTDVSGKKISFRNLVIIATSNAGSEVIKECIAANMPPKEMQDKVISFVIDKGIFRTEFLNRFEGVIFFSPLTPADIEKVTELLLRKHAARIKEEQNIDITYEAGLAPEIAKAAFDPLFGARAINRFIQDKIDDNLARKIIGGEIKKGEAYVFKGTDMV